MSTAPYETAHVDELDRVPSFQDVTWLPVRRRLGIEAFGVNAFEGDAGQLVIEEHDETGTGGSGQQEELYVVLSGRATFSIAGDDVEAPAGAFVHVRDPGARRKAVALEDGTIVLALGGTRGQPYEASPWEWTALSLAPAKEGDFERARALLEEGLERHPDNSGLLYNLACYEARDGRTEAALEHLARALELDPELRGWAGKDEDLASLHDEPAFRQLVV